MKQIPEILQMIKDKIGEHEKEMLATLADQDVLKSKLETVQKEGNMHKLMVESNKIIVLKDKALFHKAAKLVLEDILKDINA